MAAGAGTGASRRSVSRRRACGWRGRKIAAIFRRALIGDEIAPRSRARPARGSGPPPEIDVRRCRPPRRGQGAFLLMRSASACARARIAAPGRLRMTAIRKPDRQRERDERGAAVGNERQGHALGRHEVQIDGHVDRALDAKQHHQPGRRETAERILVARRQEQAA